MLTSPLLSVFIGCLLGFLSGIGIGGGSLLMLWLTAILAIPHWIARNINLLFFIPSALIASLFRRKEGNLNLPGLIPAILSGCICAAVFSFLGKSADQELVKKIFGILLLFTGLRELFYRKKQSAHQ